MRIAIIACAGALMALGAAGAATAQDTNWTYAYLEGVATATHRDAEGAVVATLTCRPPSGEIIITDATWGREVRNAAAASVRIGVMEVTVPAKVERGRRGRQTVSVSLPQRPPILAAVQPDDLLSVTVNGRTHTYGRGGPAKLEEVAYACWQAN